MCLGEILHQQPIRHVNPRSLPNESAWSGLDCQPVGLQAMQLLRRSCPVLLALFYGFGFSLPGLTFFLD